MTRAIDKKYLRLLAIAPSTRGFGFAVHEGQDTLIDWGAKRVTGDKNAESLARIGSMITHYEPKILVLEDAFAKGSRRSRRIRELNKRIVALAIRGKVRVVCLSREQVMQMFIADGKGTKHSIAEIVATRFPEELGPRLPRKRRSYDNEDPRMDIFAAVALALAFRKGK
jgi:Holliday junction resolvasome RuvABC endonuclease subunit